MGSSAPSASLQTPNWVLLLTQHMMLAKGTWTSLSSIATKTSWSSTSTSARFYIRIREVPDMGKLGWRTHWEHPCEEEFLWMEVGHKPAVSVCLQSRKPRTSWATSKRMASRTREAILLLLLCRLEIMVIQDWDPNMRKIWTCQRDKGHKNGPGEQKGYNTCSMRTGWQSWRL